MKNSGNKFTVITTTYNCREFVDGYFLAFSSLDTNSFDWIVIDAGSSDGTAEYLLERSACLTHFSVEPDSGVYFGLNNAVRRVNTPYYMVFGVDDKPSATLVEDVNNLLTGEHSLVLGAVNMTPGRRTKHAGTRNRHWISWGRVISHHSVGTVIKKEVHDRFGLYDTHYPVCADGALLKRILMSSESILFTKIVFGEFQLGGLSSQNKLRSINELFLIQVKAGESILVQLLLFNLRVILEIVMSYKKRILRYIERSDSI